MPENFYSCYCHSGTLNSNTAPVACVSWLTTRCKNNWRQQTLQTENLIILIAMGHFSLGAELTIQSPGASPTYSCRSTLSTGSARKLWVLHGFKLQAIFSATTAPQPLITTARLSLLPVISQEIDVVRLSTAVPFAPQSCRHNLQYVCWVFFSVLYRPFVING